MKEGMAMMILMAKKFLVTALIYLNLYFSTWLNLLSISLHTRFKTW